MKKIEKIPIRALLLLISFYRSAISPFLPSRCRFFPTCSSYAKEALEKHGLRRGITLTVSRLCRCHPWGSHGIDLVPCPLNQENGAPDDEKYQTIEERTTV